MEIELKKWGNSLAFRVPKDLVKSLQMSEGQKLELQVMPEGVLIKTKRRRSKRRIEDMLKNLGPMKELDWGKPVGDEVW
jgi:antitoxin MazE